MKASELLKRISYKVLSGSDDAVVTGIARDNRTAHPGDLFICISGTKFDTHSENVISELYMKGVRTFVVEKNIDCPADANVFITENTRSAGAFIYSEYYDNPAKKLKMIGITGSKGKTTTAHMLYSVLNTAGIKTGIIGTNGVAFGNFEKELANTTPDYDELQFYLSEMVKAGMQACVLEVSSQGMKLHRADGFTFDYGIFLNIQEGDHIGPNEHETFEDYLFCKAEVLNHSKKAFVHREDPFIKDFMKYVTVEPEYFGSSEELSFRGTEIKRIYDEEKRQPFISFKLSAKLSEDILLNFPGVFNVWNALAAIAVAYDMGVPAECMKKALCAIRIKGRNDIVYDGKFRICVDFAHNGASTWGHLQALREFRPKRLICIFGPDGNRSKGRRYGMGEAAGTLADFSIVTSGHNRNETFEQILSDTEVGLHRAPNPQYIAIKDREEAIRYAIDHAKDGDLITIIGLGHEHWQEEAGVKRVYNDEDFVRSVLKEKGLM